MNNLKTYCSNKSINKIVIAKIKLNFRLFILSLSEQLIDCLPLNKNNAKTLTA